MLRSACLLALALASGSVHALGLGQIQVKSGLGEPLLAEIPVISNDPTELVDLDAALASPETFTRIGLEPPMGIVADLRFTIGTDAQGRPVIRITSVQPVTQPLLNFLVEVDWGQGRLVREYTAAVDRPGSVAAVPAAPVQAPEVDAAPVIERPAPPVAQTPAPTPARPRPQVPAPAPQPVATAPTQRASQAADEYTVRAGDSASRIAARLAPEGVTVDQTMVGLLRANPAAFIAGDLNRLRGGSVLRVPAAAELQTVEAREAADLVRAHAQQWRQARSQPQAPAAASAVPASPSAPAVTPPEGRLEIVPPGAGRQARGGTQSGIAAGGEGEMLRQELVQTKETLAARDAEVQELKSRVAELEKLQADQQKLIAMQNSQLHTAQQRPAAQPAPAPSTESSSTLPWVAGGVLVMLGLLAAAWNRRRASRAPVFRAPPTESRAPVADAFEPAAEPVPGAVVAGDDVAEAVPSWGRGSARTARTPAAVETVRPVDEAAVVADPDPSQADAANVERLELAQAYLDLGDTDNARRLLGEVAETGDATARGVAVKMLRDIG